MSAYAPCPECGHLNGRVVETRNGPSYETIRRRRECSKCKNRWTTYEFTTDAVSPADAALKTIDKARRSFGGRSLR